MKKWIPTSATLALGLALVPSTLAAQEPHYGLGVVLGVPTGALNGTNYADGVNESYDSGLGVQFTMSWPLDKTLALRLNIGGTTFSGTASYPGFANQDLQDSLFNIGGEAEIFLADGSAQRHLGTYLIGGLSLDMERFSANVDDSYWTGSTSANKTRLAATVGIGHTFRNYGRWRWTLEGVYHKTLTDTSSNDYAGVGVPASDFFKLYAGMSF